MMKSSIYLFILSVCFIAGFSSCGKKFDLIPPDGIIRENYWQTKEQVHAAVIGCYASLMGNASSASARGAAETFFVWGEIRADMVTPSLGTRAEEIEIFNISTQQNNPLTDWRPIYNIINYCNTVLDYAPSVLQKDQTFTQEALDGYLAEAKALRALMYFYLVRSFGDVPLKLRSTASDEDIVQLAKSTQQEVLAQIVKDLAEAEPNAVPTYGDVRDKGRITRYTVNTIQADVALWMEDYTAAVTACDKVINSRRFGLIASSAAWYNILYRTGNSNESIFEIQFNQQKLNPFFDMHALPSTRRYIAANRVMDQIFTTEIDFFTGLPDLRSNGASVRAEDNAIWKYIGMNGEDMIAQADSYTHWFFYRYADVLLMKAEALAQMDGRGEEALALVNQVRNRASAPEATNNNPGVANKEELSLYILEERAREFAFEGKRWYDVLRYIKKNNYANIAYLQEMVAGIVPASSVRTAQAKMLDHNSHYFPIYFYELQTNKQLVQNPFYKQ